MIKLEEMRREKVIGKSLEASVSIGADSTSLPLLETYEGSLYELFNVSQVFLEAIGDREKLYYATNQDIVDSHVFTPGSPAITDTLRLKTAAAGGPKCERCWRYVPDVGSEQNYPTVCLRCAEALAAIGYPPYSAESEKGAGE